MSTGTEDLHARIEACRRRLTTEALNADTRTELLQLLTDLDQRLAPPASSTEASTTDASATSPLERLRELERSVESAHPTLCGLIGNLADSLSRMGV